MKIIALDKQVQDVNSLIPIPQFLMILIGGKGSGKSTLTNHLLLHEYKNKFNKIYFISPTCNLDQKMDILKDTKMLLRNIPLMNILNRNIIENHNRYQTLGQPILLKKDDLPEYIDEFHTEINADLINEIIKNQKYIIKNYGKEFADEILIVIDDAICSKYIKSNHFISYILLSRHYKCSIILNSQAYYLINKNLRLNSDTICLFGVSNQDEIKNIFNEWFCNIDTKDAIKLYKDIIKIPYNFIQINKKNPTNKFIKNLDEYLT